MGNAVWDFSQVAASLGPIDISSIGGFAEGSVIKYVHDDAWFGVKKGADGSVTRYRIPASVAKITFTLAQSSIVNDLLSARLISDHNTPGGSGIGAVLLKDLGGTTLVSAAHAFIEAPPQAEFGVEVGDREWSIVLMDAQPFFGGNTPI